MKKIIAIVIGLLLLCSCTVTITTDDGKSKSSIEVQKHSELVEIEFDGHTHEFVRYSMGYEGGMAHWPDCKYCKQRGTYYNY